MDEKQLIYKNLRLEYSSRGLFRDDLHSDPTVQFQQWFEVAHHSGIIEPNAFFLATSTLEGKPSCRALLMKHFDEKGLLFFTNENSRKACDLKANPYAAATFWWSNLERQIRLEGCVEPVSRDVAAAYFSSRPRQSQLGTWSSTQDKPISSKRELEESFAHWTKEFEGQEIPCPPFWVGYRLIPSCFEFWQGCAARLHNRFLYTQQQNKWQITRLSP